MQFDDESNFARELTRSALPAAILIAGVEELRVIEAADAVRAKARAEGYERSVYDVDGRFDWDELVGDFSAMSLFASSRLLDVRVPDGRVGKDGSEVITRFCKDPPPATTLLISCMDWSKKHTEVTWVRAFPKSGYVLAMWATPRHKLADWLLIRMRARGIDASHDAAELLAARVEGNLLAAAQEVDKLELLLALGVPEQDPDSGNDPGSSPGWAPRGQVGAHPVAPTQGERKGTLAATSASRPRSVRIGVDEMQRLVADSARFDAFKLTDACLTGDAVRTLRILRSLRSEGEAVPALIGPVVQQLLQLAELSAEAANGGDLRAAMTAHRIWDSKQAQFKRALERHDARRWEHFAIEAGRIDRMSKGREQGDPWIALERLMTAVCTPRARRLIT
jgi:DNA polymerase-3 subunit delta